MSKVVEQALGKVVLSFHVPTVSEGKIPSIAQTDCVAKIIFQSVLSNTGFIACITGTVSKLRDKAVDEHHNVTSKQLLQHSSAPFCSQARSTCPKSPSLITPSSDSFKESFCSCRRHCSSSRRQSCKKWVLYGCYSTSNTESHKYFERGSSGSRQSINMPPHRSRNSSKESLVVIESVNTYFWKALDYHIYRLFVRSQYYNDLAGRIVRMVRRLEVQLNSHVFSSSDPISILSLLPAFQMACNTNRIHDGDLMWLFRLFMKKPVGASLNSHTFLSRSVQAHQERKLTRCCRVLNFFPRYIRHRQHHSRG